MGHYLGEMEEDGVPLSWKGAHLPQGQKPRHSSLAMACAINKVERLTGIVLSSIEIVVYLDEMRRRSVELAPLEDALHAAAKDLTVSIVRGIRPSQGIEAEGRDAKRLGATHKSPVGHQADAPIPSPTSEP